MRRRDLIIGGTASLVARPSASRAARPYKVIGFLGSGSPYRAEDSGWIGGHRGLADTGWVDGKNFWAEYRFSQGHDDRSPGFAAELVMLGVDLLAASGNHTAALAAKKATTTIPIVFITGADPIATGIVDSLSRPGGNITGVTLLAAELNRKRFELLTELVPEAKSVGLLVNPNNPLADRRVRELEEAAQQKGFQLHIARTADKSEFDAALAALAKTGVGAATALSDTIYMSNRQLLIDTAARNALPMIYETRDFAPMGGLITYGADLFDLGYREGTYIGRILNGERPGDLPIERSSKFQLVVNMKTAKSLGIAVPRSILARADEIIED